MIDKHYGCFQSIPDYTIHIKEIPSMETAVEFEYNEVATFIRYAGNGRLFVNNHLIRLNNDRVPIPLKWYQFRLNNLMRPVRLQVYVRSMKAIRADFAILGQVWLTGSYRVKNEYEPKNTIVRVQSNSKCGYTNYTGGQDGLFKSIYQSNAQRLIRDDYCFKHHTYREYELFWMNETYKECEECGTNTIEEFNAYGLGRIISCTRPNGRRYRRNDVLIFKFTRGFVVYNTRSKNGLKIDETPYVFGDEILINNTWTPL